MRNAVNQGIAPHGQLALFVAMPALCTAKTSVATLDNSQQDILWLDNAAQLVGCRKQCLDLLFAPACRLLGLQS